MLILSLMIISELLMLIAVLFVKDSKEIIAILMAFLLGLGFSMNVSAKTNEKPVVFEWR